MKKIFDRINWGWFCAYIVAVIILTIMVHYLTLNSVLVGVLSIILADHIGRH